MKDAEKVAGLSCEERLDVSLLQELPSDDEWDEEVSPGKDGFQDAYIRCWQCSGSAGSICFWVSRGFVIYLYGSGPFPSTSKTMKKNLEIYYLQLLYDFLSLKNDVNVP